MTLSAATLGFTTVKRASLRRLPAFRLDRTRLALLLAGCCAVLTGAYVVLINQTTAQRLELNRLSRNVRQLTEKNHSLQLSVAQAQSVGGAERAAAILGLTPVARVEYVEGPGGVAAR